jgi:hypothetical protein
MLSVPQELHGILQISVTRSQKLIDSAGHPASSICTGAHCNNSATLPVLCSCPLANITVTCTSLYFQYVLLVVIKLETTMLFLLHESVQSSRHYFPNSITMKYIQNFILQLFLTMQFSGIKHICTIMQSNHYPMEAQLLIFLKNCHNIVTEAMLFYISTSNGQAF